MFKKNLDYEKVKKAMVDTKLNITSKPGQDKVFVKVSGTKIGIMYKLTLLISELIKMDMATFADLEYIIRIVKKAAKTDEFKKEHELYRKQDYLKNHKAPKINNIQIKTVKLNKKDAEELESLLKKIGVMPSELDNIEDFFNGLKED